MTIGGSLALIAIGAILRFAIKDSWEAVDLEIVGLILMIAGVIGFVVGVVLMFTSGGRRQPPPNS